MLAACIYNLKKPDFKNVNRSEHGKGSDNKQDVVEVIGNNCYIPTSGFCSVKCNKHLTGKDFRQKT